MPRSVVTSRLEKTIAKITNQSFNTAGNYPVPYGKTRFTITGRGTPGNTNNYVSAYSYNVYIAGNSGTAYNPSIPGNTAYNPSIPGNTAYNPSIPGNIYYYTTPAYSYNTYVPGNTGTAYNPPTPGNVYYYTNPTLEHHYVEPAQYAIAYNPPTPGNAYYTFVAGSWYYSGAAIYNSSNQYGFVEYYTPAAPSSGVENGITIPSRYWSVYYPASYSYGPLSYYNSTYGVYQLVGYTYNVVSAQYSEGTYAYQYVSYNPSTPGTIYSILINPAIHNVVVEPGNTVTAYNPTTPGTAYYYDNSYSYSTYVPSYTNSSYNPTTPGTAYTNPSTPGTAYTNPSTPGTAYYYDNSYSYSVYVPPSGQPGSGSPPTNVLGVTFPGAPADSVAPTVGPVIVDIPYSSTGVSIIPPVGGYITINTLL